MRKFLAVATAALGLLGATAGQVQAQHHGGGSSHGGGFHGGGFRGGGFRGGGFRGGGFRGGGFRGGGFRGGGAFAAGALGFGLGAALASPYYYGGAGYDDYGAGYDDYYDNGYDDYDAPAYACGEWQWDPYSRRQVWVNAC